MYIKVNVNVNVLLTNYCPHESVTCFLAIWSYPVLINDSCCISNVEIVLRLFCRKLKTTNLKCLKYPVEQLIH